MQRTRGASPTFVQMFIDTATAGNPIYVRSFSTKGVWSEWSQRETDAGSQAKVDAHANKKDIHVTQADKNMWNGAQLSKITNDNGGYLLTIGDDDNFLEKIVKNGRAFGTFIQPAKRQTVRAALRPAACFILPLLTVRERERLGMSLPSIIKIICSRTIWI